MFSKNKKAYIHLQFFLRCSYIDTQKTLILNKFYAISIKNEDKCATIVWNEIYIRNYIRTKTFTLFGVTPVVLIVGCTFLLP